MKSKHDELLLALHDAHGRALFSYVGRMTGDNALAQDIVQETLLKAWKQPKILEQNNDSVRAWLFTVARNLVIDDRRSARFRRESTTDTIPDVPTADETDAVLEAWIISDVLLTLSEVHRRAIVSAYYLGNSVAEIARQEEVPVGTIKSRLHYALAALKLSLQERGAGQ
ncbi:MAG: sigma-70 family RNA polymerase sigma factor [Actinomycetota bacterium]